ncbi:MAG: proteasome activator [Acidimicrobiia bacterium]|nr:proteasome activator [Acidimicrobiia bacterium]
MTTESDPQTAEDDGVEVVAEDESTPESSYVQAPKLMRIASMTRAMLDEVRQAPLDEPGRRRLIEVHERSLEEMQEVLSPDLREELAEIFLPLSSEESTESELRIAQAQLVGWLEGLFAGIQATLMSQQVAAQHQLQEMRAKAIEAQSQRRGDVTGGQYL